MSGTGSKTRKHGSSRNWVRTCSYESSACGADKVCKIKIGGDCEEQLFGTPCVRYGRDKGIDCRKVKVQAGGQEKEKSRCCVEGPGLFYSCTSESLADYLPFSHNVSPCCSKNVACGLEAAIFVGRRGQRCLTHSGDVSSKLAPRQDVHSELYFETLC